MKSNLLKTLVVIAFAGASIVWTEPVSARDCLRPESSVIADTSGISSGLRVSSGIDCNDDKALADFLHKRGFVPKGIKSKAMRLALKEIAKALKTYRFAQGFKHPPSSDAILNSLENTNLFDPYRIRHKLPVTMVFGKGAYNGEHKDNIWRIVFTIGRDFLAFASICGVETEEKDVISLASLHFCDFDDMRYDTADGVLASFLKICFDQAIFEDITNSLWGVGFNGAACCIIKNPLSRMDKKEIVEQFAVSFSSVGVLGKTLILKPGKNTDEADMAAIQARAYAAYNFSSMPFSEEGKLYFPVATSRPSDKNSFPHTLWRIRATGIVETLNAVLRLKGIRLEDATVILCGTTVIAEGVFDILLSQKTKVVGIYDGNRCMYNKNGIMSKTPAAGKVEDTHVMLKDLLSMEAAALISTDIFSLIDPITANNLHVGIVIDGIYQAIKSDMTGTGGSLSKIIYIPQCLSCGSSAYASAREFLNGNASGMDIRDPKRYLERNIYNIVNSLIFLMSRDAAQTAKHEVLIKKAGEIRNLRNRFIEVPTEEVIEEAEFEMLYGLPERIAFLRAATNIAREKVLFSAISPKALMDIVMSAASGMSEKKTAVYILGKKQELSSAPELMRIISDENEDPDLRVNAVEALGNMRAGSAIEFLIKKSRQKTINADLLNQSCWALEKMGVGLGRQDKAMIEEVSFNRAIEELPARVAGVWLNNIRKGKSKPVIVGFSGYSASGKSYFASLFAKKLKLLIASQRRKLNKIYDRGIHEMPVIYRLDMDEYLIPKDERFIRAKCLGYEPSIFIKYEMKRYYEDMKAFASGNPIYIPHFNQVTRERWRVNEGRIALARLDLAQGADNHERSIDGRRHTVVYSRQLSRENGIKAYIDLQSGDVLERLDPMNKILIVEGILTLTSESVNRAFDESVFIKAPWALRFLRDIERYIKEGKYASLISRKVEEKFERKRAAEETRFISSQESISSYIINTGDSPIAGYVEAFVRAEGLYRQWILEASASNHGLTARKEKIKALFKDIIYQCAFDEVVLGKLWTRFCQNTLVPENVALFDAVSRVVEEQNRKLWYSLSESDKVVVIENIEKNYVLGQEDFDILLFSVFAPGDMKKHVNGSSAKVPKGKEISYFTPDSLAGRGTRLIMADFDRTISSNPFAISDNIVKEIERFLASGGVFIVNTGGTVNRMRGIFDNRIPSKLRKNMILACELSSVIARYDENGKLYIDQSASLTDSFLVSAVFMDKVIKDLYLELGIKAAGEDDYDPRIHDAKIIKDKQAVFTISHKDCTWIKCKTRDIRFLLERILKTFGKDSFYMYETSRCIDVSFRSKAFGLDWAAAEFGLNPSQIVIIGDRAGLLRNDRPMLTHLPQALNIYVGIENANLLPGGILHSRIPSEAGVIEILRTIINTEKGVKWPDAVPVHERLFVSSAIMAAA
ncbi:MAG: hypothetical protein WC300_03800 [Candidatus Omnitrophota bacterium]|jgi:uridine kinase/hydroxymethylpyrimidine pyrophosphatase-like HAD family hydrolase/glutamate dehydrogenase/leucine dehydrogenase